MWRAYKNMLIRAAILLLIVGIGKILQDTVSESVGTAFSIISLIVYFIQQIWEEFIPTTISFLDSIPSLMKKIWSNAEEKRKYGTGKRYNKEKTRKEIQELEKRVNNWGN